jgi:hypothetical protein
VYLQLVNVGKILKQSQSKAKLKSKISRLLTGQAGHRVLGAWAGQLRKAEKPKLVRKGFCYEMRNENRFSCL